MLLYVADLPIHHDYQMHVVKHVENDLNIQYTGKFRWLVLPNRQPALQQQYTDRKTYELKWRTVPFVHSR